MYDDPRPEDLGPSAEDAEPTTPPQEPEPPAVAQTPPSGAAGESAFPEGPLPVCEYTGEESEEPCEEPALQRRWSGASVVVAAVLGAVTGGLVVAALVMWSLGLISGVRPLIQLKPTVLQTRSDSSAKTPAVSITPTTTVETSEAVAEKVTPAVVNISVQQLYYDPFSGQRGYQTVGNGSGVIVRSSGYILTNNHVIDGADRILVTLGVDDVQATIVGTDPSTDLAVLKIDKTGLPAIEVGSSKDLRVGQFVVAVGSPFGLEKTVTAGIISALQRSGQTSQTGRDITTYTNLIQTDAAINPGNSGGALVDASGVLIGINTLIQSTSGSSAGIGFAIPVDLAMDIADQLIKTGSATHPYMGVSTETIDENVAAQFDLPVKSGVLVRFVQPGSPAEKAGVKSGDIIVQVDGRNIRSVEDVFGATRARKVGDKVDVIIVRGDAERTLPVTLGADRSRQ